MASSVVWGHTQAVISDTLCIPYTEDCKNHAMSN